MEDRNGTIYMYTSPSGKCYIGQTWKPNKRKAAHRAMSGNSVAFF
jgi:predicted GIY-YIG superfamily endonuclease